MVVRMIMVAVLGVLRVSTSRAGQAISVELVVPLLLLGFQLEQLRQIIHTRVA